jgi:hypothetical protein
MPVKPNACSRCADWTGCPCKTSFLPQGSAIAPRCATTSATNLNWHVSWYSTAASGIRRAALSDARAGGSYRSGDVHPHDREPAVEQPRVLARGAGKKWNQGYQRCNALLRNLLSDIAPAIVDHRLSLIGIYGNASLAAWEASHDSGDSGGLWSPQYAVSSMMDTFESVLTAVPSEETRSLLAGPDSES